MIKFYIKNKNEYLTLENIHEEDLQDVIWIDLLSPNSDEIKYIENNFTIELPTKHDSEEIEISSRYWEEDDKIEINSYFLLSTNHNANNETVSFILQDNLLVSIRYVKLKTFDEVSKKFYFTNRLFNDGSDILNNILDIRIDADADTIEQLSRDITKIRRLVFTDYKNEDEEILEKISHYEDLNMKIRENLTDKQRILTSLLKSSLYKPSLKEELQIMIKDIKSLIEHTQFNFERLEYLQNIFLGVLGIEQNKVIKIFTIVNVIFLPPTLIASIYGMNFDIIPELHWEYGYIFSIGLMILSAITPIFIFKKKGLI